MQRLYPFLFVFLWSTGFIGAKYGLPYAEPLSFLLIRYGFVIALMTAIALATRAPWPKDPKQWVHIGVSGVLVHAVYLGGGTIVMRDVNAGTAPARVLRTTDPALREVRVSGDTVTLGAGVTMADVLANRDLEFLHPAGSELVHRLAARRPDLRAAFRRSMKVTHLEFLRARDRARRLRLYTQTNARIPTFRELPARARLAVLARLVLGRAGRRG